ncbi:hypothetical protein JCM10207_000539 [Rhodosporidiobolus poonsookiae]
MPSLGHASASAPAGLPERGGHRASSSASPGHPFAFVPSSSAPADLAVRRSWEKTGTYTLFRDSKTSINDEPATPRSALSVQSFLDLDSPSPNTPPVSLDHLAAMPARPLASGLSALGDASPTYMLFPPPPSSSPPGETEDLLNLDRPPSPPSPSYPFPRMPLNAPKGFVLSSASRPPLVSAFTTCTTIRAGRSSGSSFECSTIAGSDDDEDEDEEHMREAERKPAWSEQVSTPEEERPTFLPPSPPATLPRRARPTHLVLDPFSAISGGAVLSHGDGDDSPVLTAPPLPDAPPSAHLPFFPIGSCDTPSAGALEEFEHQHGFPWRWSPSLDSPAPLPHAPSQPYLPPSSAGVASLRPAETFGVQDAPRRRTLGNGEIARVQRTLHDVEQAFVARSSLPATKRQALYIPAQDDFLPQDVGQHAESRPLSTASSISSLSSLRYVEPDDPSFEQDRLASPASLRSTTRLDWGSSTAPSSAETHSSNGLRKLRLSSIADAPPPVPQSTSPSSARASWISLSRLPFTRKRSSSAPAPLPPVPFSPSPPSSRMRSSGSPLAHRTSIGTALSSLPSLSSPSDDPEPDYPSLPSSTQPSPPSSSASTVSLSATALFPSPLLTSASPATTYDSGVPSASPAGDPAELKTALRDERRRSAALADEVWRLQRVVAVLTGVTALED